MPPLIITSPTINSFMVKSKKNVITCIFTEPWGTFLKRCMLIWRLMLACARSYEGECGHALVHMKVNFPPIYSLKICWESNDTNTDMSIIDVPAISETYSHVKVVGYHGHSSPHSQDNYALLTRKNCKDWKTSGRREIMVVLFSSWKSSQHVNVSS